MWYNTAIKYIQYIEYLVIYYSKYFAIWLERDGSTYQLLSRAPRAPEFFLCWNAIFRPNRRNLEAILGHVDQPLSCLSCQRSARHFQSTIPAARPKKKDKTIAQQITVQFFKKKKLFVFPFERKNRFLPVYIFGCS